MKKLNAVSHLSLVKPRFITAIITLLSLNTAFGQTPDTIVYTPKKTWDLLNSGNIYSSPSKKKAASPKARGGHFSSEEEGGCSGTCSSQNVTIKTGYNNAGDSILPGVADNNWIVVSDPPAAGYCTNTIEPRNAFTIAQSGAWNTISGCGWISGYPSNGATCGGEYVFVSKFCLNEERDSVSIRFRCLADNTASIYLNGTLIKAQPNEYGFKTVNMIDTTVTDPLRFVTGENIITVHLVNDGSIMGLNLQADISLTEGCINCCNTNGSITGVKYLDGNSRNHIIDETDTGFEGIIISLYDEDDSLIATTITDYLGLYNFPNVLPGDYTIRETVPSDQTAIIPSGGEYSITVHEFEAVSAVNLLNEYTPLPPPCKECVSSFSPPIGKYIVSAWVKERSSTDTELPPGTTTYNDAKIHISFSGSGTTYDLTPSGAIIDGWQRIEEEIEIPAAADSMAIQLKSDGNISYFDDLRFFPTDGSMQSYVYDPVTMRLMAELDERHYATFYEYDEEGKLVRVKKETEKGVMTIQENRDNLIKKP